MSHVISSEPCYFWCAALSLRVTSSLMCQALFNEPARLSPMSQAIFNVSYYSISVNHGNLQLTPLFIMSLALSVSHVISNEPLQYPWVTLSPIIQTIYHESSPMSLSHLQWVKPSPKKTTIFNESHNLQRAKPNQWVHASSQFDIHFTRTDQCLFYVVYLPLLSITLF